MQLILSPSRLTRARPDVAHDGVQGAAPAGPPAVLSRGAAARSASGPVPLAAAPGTLFPQPPLRPAAIHYETETPPPDSERR